MQEVFTNNNKLLEFNKIDVETSISTYYMLKACFSVFERDAYEYIAKYNLILSNNRDIKSSIVHINPNILKWYDIYI